MLVFKF